MKGIKRHLRKDNKVDALNRENPLLMASVDCDKEVPMLEGESLICKGCGLMARNQL